MFQTTTMENSNKKKFSLKEKYFIYKYKVLYTIDQILSIKFRQYIFIDAWSAIFFSIIVILNVLFNLNKIGIPYIFPSLTTCIEILETLVRTVVVLLSIIFSFTLLSFQVFNKYFGRFAFTDFFKRKHLKVMFTLFILNVSFLIYAISYLKSNLDADIVPTYGKVIFIEAILFSVFLIISIFPVMIDLLSKSQSRTNLKSLFNAIENTATADYRFFDDSIKDDEYENNTFKIISEIGLAAIKDFDITTFDILVRSIFQKSKNIFGSDKIDETKRQLYYNFSDNLNDFFSYAVKEKNSTAQLRVIIARWGIEEEAIKHNFLIDFKGRYYGWSFNRDTENFYNKTIQNNEDQISADIIDKYCDFFSKIIEMLLPETFKYNFDKPFNSMDDTNIISTNYSLVDSLAKTATTYKKTIVLKELCNLFMTLDLTIIGSKNTGESKNYLLQINNIHKEKFVKYLVENAHIKNIEFQYFPFGIGNTQELSVLKSSVILKAELKIVDYLFANKLLNNLVLNDIKVVAFHIIHNFTEDIPRGKALLEIILAKFDHIRGLIKQDSTLENMDLYINLERYINYIRNDYSLTGTDYGLSDEIRHLTNRFEYVKGFKEKLSHEGFIQNTSMF